MPVSAQDAQIIIAETRRRLDSLGPIIRMAIPPLPQILENIPQVARKYTVQEIIDLYWGAYRQGLLR